MKSMRGSGLGSQTTCEPRHQQVDTPQGHIELNDIDWISTPNSHRYRVRHKYKELNEICLTSCCVILLIKLKISVAL